MLAVSLPSQERRTTSFACKSAVESQRPWYEAGALGEVVAPPAPWKMWIWPPVDAPAVYSAASTPMRSGKHSSESALPVDIAMSGRSPSDEFAGRCRLLSGCGLSTHVSTLGIVNCIRHLPVWTTSGTFWPAMTGWPPALIEIVKCPVESVTADAFTVVG